MATGGHLHDSLVHEADQKKCRRTSHTPTADVRAGDARAVANGEHAIPSVAPISSAELAALEAKKIVIDVMMLYTKRAASHYMLNPADVLEDVRRTGQ